nr:4-hydroxybenzoate polyprenyltransferase, mitochondrial [Quercus suber]
MGTRVHLVDADHRFDFGGLVFRGWAHECIEIAARVRRRRWAVGGTISLSSLAKGRRIEARRVLGVVCRLVHVAAPSASASCRVDFLGVSPSHVKTVFKVRTRRSLIPAPAAARQEFEKSSAADTAASLCRSAHDGIRCRHAGGRGQMASGHLHRSWLDLMMCSIQSEPSAGLQVLSKLQTNFPCCTSLVHMPSTETRFTDSSLPKRKKNPTTSTGGAAMSSCLRPLRCTSLRPPRSTSFSCLSAQLQHTSSKRWRPWIMARAWPTATIRPDGGLHQWQRRHATATAIASTPQTPPPSYSPPTTGLLARLPASWVPYAELIRLDKPVGTYYLFLPCLFSTLLAAPLTTPITPPSTILATTVLFFSGALIMRGAGCTINDLWDRNLDPHVARTRLRPIARGAITPAQALPFLGAQLLAGLAILLQFPPACFVYATPSLLFVTLYPLAKRVTHYPQAVLGLTFSWGAVLGFPALGLDLLTHAPAALAAAALYASCVAWTVVYDMIYAYQDIRDDAPAGIKSIALAHAANAKVFLSAVAGVQVGLLAAGGWALEASPIFYVGTCGGAAATLAYMIRVVDLDSVADCWAWFRRGAWFTGGAITLGLAGEYARAYYMLETAQDTEVQKQGSGEFRGARRSSSSRAPARDLQRFRPASSGPQSLLLGCSEVELSSRPRLATESAIVPASFPTVLLPVSRLDGLLCHRQRARERRVAADEAACVHEDAAGHAADGAQLVVAHAAPRLGQAPAVLEAAGLEADGADAPLAIGRAALGEQRVQHLARHARGRLEAVEMVGPRHALGLPRNNDDAALGIVLRARLEGLLHDGTRGQPGASGVIELQQELLADEGAGLEEAGVFLAGGGSLAACGGGVRRGRHVVVAAHDAGDAEAFVREPLVDTCCAEGRGVVDGDAVVVAVKGFDEVFVQLLVEELHVGARLVDAGHGVDDVFAIVHPDQTRAGELGGFGGERGVELALVVVVAQDVVVVHPADIDDDGAGVQQLGVSGPDERGLLVVGEEAEEEDGQGFVGVEVAVVGTDDRRRHLDTLVGRFGHEGARESRRRWGWMVGQGGMVTESDIE